MAINPNKTINYCFIDDEGVSRKVIVIKWEKENLYIMDINQPWKVSYHSPRNGKSQIHLKVNGSMPLDPSFEVPIEEIKGFRMLNGAGMELYKLGELPKANPNEINYILDTRELHISHMSKVQWTHYLVEPNNETELNELLKKHEDNEKRDKMSERIFIHKLTNSTPWIITVFTRICDENPEWYKD